MTSRDCFVDPVMVRWIIVPMDDGARAGRWTGAQFFSETVRIVSENGPEGAR